MEAVFLIVFKIPMLNNFKERIFSKTYRKKCLNLMDRVEIKTSLANFSFSFNLKFIENILYNTDILGSESFFVIITKVQCLFYD